MPAGTLCPTLGLSNGAESDYHTPMSGRSVGNRSPPASASGRCSAAPLHAPGRRCRPHAFCRAASDSSLLRLPRPSGRQLRCARLTSLAESIKVLRIHHAGHTFSTAEGVPHVPSKGKYVVQLNGATAPLGVGLHFGLPYDRNMKLMKQIVWTSLCGTHVSPEGHVGIRVSRQRFADLRHTSAGQAERGSPNRVPPGSHPTWPRGIVCRQSFGSDFLGAQVRLAWPRQGRRIRHHQEGVAYGAPSFA